MEKKEEWGSKAGFILAAVGSAVGLGNIWRFPYVVYSSGGGAFFLPYFCAIFTAGIPLLILEYSLGHKLRASTPRALSKIHKNLEWTGWWPIISSGFILCYYSLILGWAVNYLVLSVGNGWGTGTDVFFHSEFLMMTESPTDLGRFVPYVGAGIALIWLLGYVVCVRGIKKGLEKLNKILLPLLLLIMLIIVGKSLTMDGAMDGLNLLFTPDFSRLWDPQIWISAYAQVFFSLSLASGIMITFSSYLPQKSDINNSAFMTAFANCGFEFLCSIGVFAILGAMMKLENLPMSELEENGIGLAFVVFPRFFSETGTVFLGVLFFLCLLFAGLTSSVSLIENLTAPVMEKFGLSRKKTVLAAVLGGFTVSMIFATGAGLHILDIVDNFISSYSIVTIGLLEAIIGGWIVGPTLLRQYVNGLSYFRVGRWWDFTVKYLTPGILTVVLLQSLLSELMSPYGGYSRGASILYGWLVIGVGIIGGLILSKKPWKGVEK